MNFQLDFVYLDGILHTEALLMMMILTVPKEENLNKGKQNKSISV